MNISGLKSAMMDSIQSKLSGKIDGFKSKLEESGLDPSTATVGDIRAAGITGPGGVEFGARLEEKLGIENIEDMTLSDMKSTVKDAVSGFRAEARPLNLFNSVDIAEVSGADTELLDSLFARIEEGDKSARSELKSMIQAQRGYAYGY